ncbi:MAG: hypothetical protein KKG67_01440 [Gammaproteobacteria bacterium]|nr:hypothetical protein [Gammaproteobacteria bacterium]
MDFLKILKSFEDFVYEALIWLILLPKTLLRIVLRPRQMVAYVQAEQTREGDDRYGDAISPPLLLILCVLVSHVFDLALRKQGNAEMGRLAGALLNSEQNLLLYRTMAFGIWSLAGAVWYMRHSRQPIHRVNLRNPFYEQCYLVAPFAMAMSISTTFALSGGLLSAAGVGLALLALLWFFVAEWHWVRERAGLGAGRAAVVAGGLVLVGLVANTGLGYLLRHL